MRNSPFWLILAACMVLLDVYVFQAVKLLAQSAAPRTRLIIYIIYWVVSILAILLLFLLPVLGNNYQNLPKTVRSTIFAIVAGLFFGKLLAAVFFLVDDVRRGIQWIAGKFMFRNTEGEDYQSGGGISRSVFLSWTGAIAGSTLFGSLLYGFSNKYRYQVKRLELAYENLPSAFKGLKIVHFSDTHCGSLNDRKAVEKGVKMIMREKPDIILFTGDLVNDRASEMDQYKEVFGKLDAPFGVYSTLGNHDYGDYARWESEQEKRDNLEQLKMVHREMGWKLLMNEHTVLEKENSKIGILGVENWSAKSNFPAYGRLDHAYNGTEEIPFKILMSHDPSHWDGEVREKYPDIDLMLSGHTHGMQFGVELPGFRWSPVQYVYRQWAGLYEEGRQKLYVNRGFGFIGYPGRVGILPEITVINLV